MCILFELLVYGFTQNTEYINLYEQLFQLFIFVNDILCFFVCNFTSHGICINFDQQQIYYLTNLHFFVAFVGQPKSVLTRYLGTLFGFEDYELLDFTFWYDLCSSIVQLKVKHQLLHSCGFDDQTSMKILEFQRHTVNIRNNLIHQRKITIVFLDHLKISM